MYVKTIIVLLVQISEKWSSENKDFLKKLSVFCNSVDTKYFLRHRSCMFNKRAYIG